MNQSERPLQVTFSDEWVVPAAEYWYGVEGRLDDLLACLPTGVGQVLQSARNDDGLFVKDQPVAPPGTASADHADMQIALASPARTGRAPADAPVLCQFMGKQGRSKVPTRAAGWLVVAALVVASCGDGDSAVPSDRLESTAPATSTALTEENEAPDDSRAAERVAALAATAITELGSDDAATDAILLAIDAGYSFEQIRAAIMNAALGADGTIDSVEPEGGSTTLVVGLRAPSTEPREPTPVEILRRKAQEMAEATDDVAMFVTGRTGAAVVLALAALGYSAEQIVDALVLGIQVDRRADEADLDGRCRRAVEDGALDLEATVFTDCADAIDTCLSVFVIGGEVAYAPACEPIYRPPTEVESAGEESGPTTTEPVEVEIADTSYNVGATTGQLEEYNQEVLGGTLDVSTAGGELLVTGNLDVLSSLWGDGNGGMRCGAKYSVVVGAVGPIAEEMSIRLYATDFGEWEFVGDCDPDQWTRAAESRFESYTETGVAQMRVVVDEGTLVGSIGFDAAANNLQRAG